MFTMIPIVEDSLMLPSDLNSAFLPNYHIVVFHSSSRELKTRLVTSLNYLDIT